MKHFADLFSRENNFRTKRFSVDAMAALQRHRWKGNVRELRNTVERLIIMTAGDVIDVADLPEALRGAARAAAPEGNAEKLATLREFKESAERAFMVEKLRENAWNISKTAEAIGTPRSNLYKKLEQYNIRQEQDS